VSVLISSKQRKESKMYELDPDLAPAMADLAAKAEGASPPSRGDWKTVREVASAGLAYMASITPSSKGVSTSSFWTPTKDGADEIGLRWYTTAGAVKGPAVVYTHGGGMIAGSVESTTKLCLGMWPRARSRFSQ
jgi:acetyl esterase/lipase